MKEKVYHIPSKNLSNPTQTAKTNGFIDSLIQNRHLFGHGDQILWLFMALLMPISLLAIFSATLDQEPTVMLMKQAMAILAGLILLAALRLVPNHWFSHVFWTNSLAILVVALIIYASKFGHIGGGASSWIKIGGFQFQPSELFKIVMILIWSRFLTDSKKSFILSLEKSRLWKYILPMLLLLVGLFFIFRQPDLGTTVITAAVAFGLTMVYLWSTKQNLIFLTIMMPALSIIFFVGKKLAASFAESGSHMLQRIGSYFDPFAYQHGIGYQVIQSYKAIAKGGLVGVGIGQGTVKNLLPEAHTDFILAVIAEEGGLLAAGCVIIILMALVFYLLRVASSMNKRFHRISITGFAILILIQTFVNIGGLSGLIPLTGVTLPFVSYGGSSMMINLLMIGIVQKFVAEEERMRLQAQASHANFKKGEL